MPERPDRVGRARRSLAVGFLLLGMSVGIPVSKCAGQPAASRTESPPPGAGTPEKAEGGPVLPAETEPPPESPEGGPKGRPSGSDKHEEVVPTAGSSAGEPAAVPAGPQDLPPPTRLPAPGDLAAPAPVLPDGPVVLPPSPLPGLPAEPGCTTCGAGLLGALFSPGEACGCGAAGCVPGRLQGCSHCDARTVVGRFLCGVYECICCPDPCYEPRWKPLADSAFFVESARPKTQQRFRWDSGHGLILPDRNEYFWARADGRGKGPRPPGGVVGPFRLGYNELSLYTEAATGNLGVFAETPYRSVEPAVYAQGVGFADINLGTKTLLFDCELLQIAFVFRTYLLTGNVGKGLGVGHVSLEPSLIVGVKLGPETYFQGQLAEWIPLGGDPDYAGAVLRYGFAVNHTLTRVLPDVPLVGTMEVNGWTFQDGAYTDPLAGPLQRSSGDTYLTLGLGLRLFVCDTIDFGVGFAQALTDQHFAEQLYRTEFRLRF